MITRTATDTRLRETRTSPTTKEFLPDCTQAARQWVGRTHRPIVTSTSQNLAVVEQMFEDRKVLSEETTPDRDASI